VVFTLLDDCQISDSNAEDETEDSNNKLGLFLRLNRYGENVMSRGFTAGVLTLFIPIFLFVASCASSGDDKMENETQKRYSSPKAVFDAYREVRGKREWGKLFSLLTPETQKNAVFEAFFSCMMLHSKEASAIVKNMLIL
jgi:hypothetical protein